MMNALTVGNLQGKFEAGTVRLFLYLIGVNRMAERNYYMVRAMLSADQDFRIFFDNNVVAVGWSDVDFVAYPNSEDLREAVRLKYYDSSNKAQQQISRKLNEVERFKGIEKGDYIIIPYRSSIALAVADGKELYSKSVYEQDLANQHLVTYRYFDSALLQIPRNELSEGMQRRLRVRGTTVANLFEFRDEIETIFERRSYSYSQEMQLLEQVERNSLKEGLLDNIQHGKTNLQTGGIGLETLVCELMRCEGYDAKVLAKSKFTGKADADIQAMKEDAFMSKKIFVQVKHHSGYSGKQGVQQVIDVLKDDDYDEYEGYFITSAGIDDETRAFASDNGIEVMDGEALVELIIVNLDRLSDTTKRLLGISPFPHILASGNRNKETFKK